MTVYPGDTQDITLVINNFQSYKWTSAIVVLVYDDDGGNDYTVITNEIPLDVTS